MDQIEQALFTCTSRLQGQASFQENVFGGIPTTSRYMKDAMPASWRSNTKLNSTPIVHFKRFAWARQKNHKQNRVHPYYGRIDKWMYPFLLFFINLYPFLLYFTNLLFFIFFHSIWTPQWFLKEIWEIHIIDNEELNSCFSGSILGKAPKNTGGFFLYFPKTLCYFFTCP